MTVTVTQISVGGSTQHAGWNGLETSTRPNPNHNYEPIELNDQNYRCLRALFCGDQGEVPQTTTGKVKHVVSEALICAAIGAGGGTFVGGLATGPAGAVVGAALGGSGGLVVGTVRGMQHVGWCTIL